MMYTLEITIFPPQCNNYFTQRLSVDAKIMGGELLRNRIFIHSDSKGEILQQRFDDHLVKVVIKSNISDEQFHIMFSLM